MNTTINNSPDNLNNTIYNFINNIIKEKFLDTFHNTSYIINNLTNPLFSYNANVKKHIHFGPEGIGKSYSALTLSHLFKHNNINFVISNSNKQSEERFNDFHDIINLPGAQKENKFIASDKYLIKSNNQLLKEMLYGDNEEFKKLLTGSDIDKKVEIIPYIINKDNSYVYPCKLDKLPIYVNHNINNNGYTIEYQHLIATLLSDIKKVFTKSNLTEKYDLFYDIEKDDGLLLLFRVSKNDEIIKIDNKKYGHLLTDSDGSIRDKINNSDIFKNINIDNEKAMSINVSEFIEDDEYEYYMTIISNRSMKRSAKIFENNDKQLKQLRNLKFLNSAKEKPIFYFIEMLTFKNVILTPLLDEFINKCLKLSDNNLKKTSLTRLENKLYEYLHLFENINILMDEIPHELTNLIDLIYLDSSNIKLPKHLNDEYHDFVNTNLYNHWYAKKNFKSNRVINIYDIWETIHDLINNNKQINRNLKYKLGSKIWQLNSQKTLNILLTLFDNVNVATSEIYPLIILSFYGFDPFIKTDDYSLINNSNNLNEATRLLISYNQIDKQISTGEINKRKFFKDKPIVDLQFIEDPFIKPIKSNHVNISHLMKWEKQKLKNANECLIVGNNIFKPDITFETLKGSNNQRERNDNNIEKSNKNLNMDSYIKKIVSICSPNNPTKMFKNTSLLKESLTYLLNNSYDNVYSKFIDKKTINMLKEINEYIEENKNFSNDIDMILSFITYADNINQVIGRFGYPRIYGRNIKLPYMKFYIPILKTDNYDLTFMLYNMIKMRYPHFTEYQIIKNANIFDIKREIKNHNTKYFNSLTSIRKWLNKNDLKDIKDYTLNDKQKDMISNLLSYLHKNRKLNSSIMRTIYMFSNIIHSTIVENINEDNFKELAKQYTINHVYMKSRYKKIDSIKNKFKEKENEINEKIQKIYNTTDKKEKYKIIKELQKLYPQVFDFEYIVNNANKNLTNKVDFIKKLTKDEKKVIKKINQEELFLKFITNLKLNILISMLYFFNISSEFDNKINYVLDSINNELFKQSNLYYNVTLIQNILMQLDIPVLLKEGLLISDDIKEAFEKIDNTINDMRGKELTFKDLLKAMRTQKTEYKKIEMKYKKKLKKKKIQILPNLNPFLLKDIFNNKNNPLKDITSYKTFNDFTVNKKEIYQHFNINEKDVKNNNFFENVVRNLNKEIKNSNENMIYNMAYYSNHLFMPLNIAIENDSLNINTYLKNSFIVNDHIIDCINNTNSNKNFTFKIINNSKLFDLEINNFEFIENIYNNINNNTTTALNNIVNNNLVNIGKLITYTNEYKDSSNFNTKHKETKIKYLNSIFNINNGNIYQNYLIEYTKNHRLHNKHINLEINELFNKLGNLNNISKSKKYQTELITSNIKTFIKNQQRLFIYLLRSNDISKNIKENVINNIHKLRRYYKSSSNITSFKPFNDLFANMNEMFNFTKVYYLYNNYNDLHIQ